MMKIYISLKKKVRPFIASTQENDLTRTSVEVTNGQGESVSFPIQKDSELTLGTIHLEDAYMIDDWISNHGSSVEEDTYNDTKQAQVDTETLLGLEAICLDTSATYAINKDRAIEMAREHLPSKHGVIYNDNYFKTLEEVSSKLHRLVNIPGPNDIEGVKFSQYYTYNAYW